MVCHGAAGGAGGGAACDAMVASFVFEPEELPNQKLTTVVAFVAEAPSRYGKLLSFVHHAMAIAARKIVSAMIETASGVARSVIVAAWWLNDALR